MLSFDNTEIAFSSKSDRDLKRSYWLFKIIGSPVLVNIGSKLTPIAISLHLPIRGLIRATIFKQFVGGEDIKDCTDTINYLNKYGIGTILDYSVEGKTTESDFDNTMRETIATIERAKGDKSIPFSVFKTTGLARLGLLEAANNGIDKLNETEKQEYQRVYNRLDAICKKAHDLGVSVFIDAEESWIQNTIDAIANDMMKKYNSRKPIVYNTFQLYRHDRLAYLKHSFDLANQGNYFLGAKLVRGAYMEKERERALQKGYPSPIQPDKEATDRDYNDALRFCAANYTRIGLCAGSHNEESSLLLTKLMQESNIPANHPHIYFSQLLGMSDHISFNLSKQHYNVAKYVPYGPVKEVLPYLIRRAQENTSVKGQTGRELSLIIKEKNRRRK